MKDDRVYLNHILQCIERILRHRRVGHKRFLEGVDLEIIWGIMNNEIVELKAAVQEMQRVLSTKE